MSSLKDKLSSMVDSFTDLLHITGDGIQKIIKENKQFLDSELEALEESEEGIQTLKEYALNETPSLKKAVESLATLFSKIMAERSKRIDGLRYKFITPLEELLVVKEKKSEELKEAEKAKKNLEKARKSLQKEKSKPEEKKKPEKLQAAEQAYQQAERNYNKEESEAGVAKVTFNKERIRVFKDILSNIVNIEETYHKNILDEIPDLKAKINAITEEEAEEELTESKEVKDQPAEKTESESQ